MTDPSFLFFSFTLSRSLSVFSFFHSPSHSLLKRLSHWFAFCCGESGEVAQCVLVKAVPHLPRIIRQLCWKHPSLIPLWWPISHHKEDSGLVFLCRSLFIYPRPALSSSSIDTVSTWGGKISSCQYWLVCTVVLKRPGRVLAAVSCWMKTSSYHTGRHTINSNSHNWCIEVTRTDEICITCSDPKFALWGV